MKAIVDAVVTETAILAIGFGIALVVLWERLMNWAFREA